MLGNRFCVVVVSVAAHGRAMPLIWQTLEHPSASVNASVSFALLEKADQLLSDAHCKSGSASQSLLPLKADQCVTCTARGESVLSRDETNCAPGLHHWLLAR